MCVYDVHRYIYVFGLYSKQEKRHGIDEHWASTNHCNLYKYVRFWTQFIRIIYKAHSLNFEIVRMAVDFTPCETNTDVVTHTHTNTHNENQKQKMKSHGFNYVPLSAHKQKIMILSQWCNATNNNNSNNKHTERQIHIEWEGEWGWTRKKELFFNIFADLACACVWLCVAWTVFMQNMTTGEMTTAGNFK